ncbi:Membrane-associated protein containing RNA-binding TRAM domain and ribonuclease PIN-domain, YacL B.subtilis ortholog [hydrothermal vent metagenome]|uniref:Membrane-associated protein containing RNA-binding TRAM domain and ribonuclease PIN-domain, YacL B.subtilis ortholog n=1 Tax=hydrothermal vent metagenome TaxID=652676 RepID=A0A3B0SAY9_9ZZZZ
MMVEAIRLLVTLATTAIGFSAGRSIASWFPSAGIDSDTSIVWGALLGAAIGYVLGGVLGRRLRSGISRAPELLRRATGPQLFAGTFGALAGMVTGTIVAVPLIAFFPATIAWPLAGLIVLVISSFGASVFAGRAHELLAVAGLRERQPLRRTEVDPAETIGSSFVVDSSAAIDGRLLELARTGIMSGAVLVPEFVIDELQAVADAADKAKRRRGRRGLDILDVLRDVESVDFHVIDHTVPEHDEVDAKLLVLCDRFGATLVTTDHNLAKAAAVRDVRVLNPHLLSEVLKPQFVMGDSVEILIQRAGSEPGQGVGFLEDGTMVVVEDGAGMVGAVVKVEVSNMMRTSIGRMVFAQIPS